MDCYICQGDMSHVVHLPPDKYQALAGNITMRDWYQCPECGFYQQTDILNNRETQRVYEKYRDTNMRETTVAEEFARIHALPEEQSENKYRVQWICENVPDHMGMTVLDIGSGLGVFPYLMQRYFKTVSCIEPNIESAEFIADNLLLECYRGYYKPGVFGRQDVVTLVHVLEHMDDPKRLLEDIGAYDLRYDGYLYVEVPDAVEFTYLSGENDEFNSLHRVFFTVDTLHRMIEDIGYTLEHIHCAYYDTRNLSRIMLLARNC